MRWRWLLTGAVVASAPQIAALILKADRLDGGAITPPIVFGLLYLATALQSNSRQRRWRPPSRRSLRCSSSAASA